MCGVDEENLEVILRCKVCNLEKNVSKDYPEVADKMKADLKKTIEG